MKRLAVFDLDHTLLSADSDQLWCDFLIDEGLLEPVHFGTRNAELERGYRDGSVSVQAFCDFYVGTLAGRTPAQWQPLRERFLHERVLPCVCPGTPALLQRHRDAGDLLLMSTATNHFITELTAQALGFAHLLATDCEIDAQGRFSGRTQGVLNMRQGKVARLQAWLAERGRALADVDSWFYSDSKNDLPLLQAVQHPVVVDGDEVLRAHAAQQGWPCISLRG